MRARSGVATYRALGHALPLKFCKFCALCSCCQRNCKNFENYREKHVLYFHLSRQMNAKTVSEPKRTPGQGRRGTIHVVLPLTSFPGDATARTHTCRHARTHPPTQLLQLSS